MTYQEALGEMVRSAERFAVAVRRAAIIAHDAGESPALDAAASAAIHACRATLLETLNDVPTMRLIYTVTPLR